MSNYLNSEDVKNDAISPIIFIMLLKMCEGIMESEKDKKIINVLIRTIEEMR